MEQKDNSIKVIWKNNELAIYKIINFTETFVVFQSTQQ